MASRDKKTNKNQLIFAILLIVLAISGLVWYASGKNVAILNPKGLVAAQQKNLIMTSVALMLVIVIPVLVMTFFIAWKYRAGRKAKYAPDMDRNPRLQTIWWVLPSVIILILASLTWTTAHQLDPYKKITSDKPAVNIQVVALQWKWLFIYPEQNIASVNFVEFPVDRPVHFELTADGLMNSFWIPNLNGQIYAMAGMSTQLNLMATEVGEYPGSAAEINGKGFSGMKFVAKAVYQNDFDNWVDIVKGSPNALDNKAYANLAMPSENHPEVFFSEVTQNLYDKIIMKYMMPHN